MSLKTEKVPTIAVAQEVPARKKGILTAGKEYEIISINTELLTTEFEIYGDNEEWCFCLEKGCAHLDGGNWTLK